MIDEAGEPITLYKVTRYLNGRYYSAIQLGVLALEYTIGKQTFPMINSPIFCFASLIQARDFARSRDNTYNPPIHKILVVETCGEIDNPFDVPCIDWLDGRRIAAKWAISNMGDMGDIFGKSPAPHGTVCVFGPVTPIRVIP